MVNSRNKGAQVEREFAALARELAGLRLVRNLEQSRSGGHDLNGLPGWAIEVKARAERPGPVELEQMWDQTVSQAASASARPVLVVKVNRRGWICYVDAHDMRPECFPRGLSLASLEPCAFFRLARFLEGAA